jgi:hypothetical protein
MRFLVSGALDRTCESIGSGIQAQQDKDQKGDNHDMANASRPGRHWATPLS